MTLHRLSPREIRELAKPLPDFRCEACGEEWDQCASRFWVTRMYCPKCGNETEMQ